MSRHFIVRKTGAFLSPLSPVRNDLSGCAISSRAAVVSHGGEGWGEGARRTVSARGVVRSRSMFFWRNTSTGQAVLNGGVPPPPPPPPPPHTAGGGARSG